MLLSFIVLLNYIRPIIYVCIYKYKPFFNFSDFEELSIGISVFRTDPHDPLQSDPFSVVHFTQKIECKVFS